MRLVWKLLRQHISPAQLTGFFVANLVGVSVILLGAQFYMDCQAIGESDRFMSPDYLIINKQIGATSALGIGGGGFTADEIEEIEREDFARDVCAFTPSTFDVQASFDAGGAVSLSTKMFFESVPDRFVDVSTSEWEYSEGSEVVPIILPRSYLELYNFGYAQSHGLPALSEGLLGAVRLDIRVRGNGHSDRYEGRIVGFSSRLGTILVPETFMAAANRLYGSGEIRPARLVVNVSDPTDERVTTFLNDRGYETDEGKLHASKTAFVLRLAISAVMGIGVIISLLSFYILMLSVFLLVQKNSGKLANLLLIGFSPAQVSVPYQTLAVGLTAGAAVIAIGVMMLVRGLYLDTLAGFFPDYEAPGVLPSVLLCLALAVVAGVFGSVAVRTKVRDIQLGKGVHD